MKADDIIKLDTGIFIDSNYPPFTLMIGYKHSGVQYKFDNLKEVEDVSFALTKLKEFIYGK